MKKLPALPTIIIATVALIVGILIGYSLRSTSPSGEELAGTIGKVDRYRNVKVSQNDILLRNELVDDTIKRNQYEKYLMYYYYASLKTSSDLEQVLTKVKTVDDFQKISAQHDKRLSNLQEYHTNARPDILKALNLLVSMNKNQNEPVIDQLNLAQNIISRIKNQSEILIDYMNVISAFVESHPAGKNSELANAYDILNINVIQQALVTHDKPVLKYFHDKQLMNSKEGVKELRNLESFKEFVKDQVNTDADSGGIQDQAYQDQVVNDVVTYDQVVSDAFYDQVVSDVIILDQVVNDSATFDQAVSDITYDQVVSDAVTDQVVNDAIKPD
jgi:hypothetical protein